MLSTSIKQGLKSSVRVAPRIKRRWRNLVWPVLLLARKSCRVDRPCGATHEESPLSRTRLLTSNTCVRAMKKLSSSMSFAWQTGGYLLPVKFFRILAFVIACRRSSSFASITTDADQTHIRPSGKNWPQASTSGTPSCTQSDFVRSTGLATMSTSTTRWWTGSESSVKS